MQGVGITEGLLMWGGLLCPCWTLVACLPMRPGIGGTVFASAQNGSQKMDRVRLVHAFRSSLDTEGRGSLGTPI